MTNKDNARGGAITGAMESANFNQLTNEYIIAETDATALYLGDFVRITTDSIRGIPVCTRANAGESLRGIVTGFQALQNSENITYRKANTERVVFVCDDPNVEFDIQASGELTASDIGKNVELLVANGDPATGVSGTQLDLSSAGTGPGQIKIMALLDRVDNGLGLYAKVRCIMFEHDLRGYPGSGTLNHADLLNLSYDTAGHGTGFTGFQRGTTNSTSNPAVTDDSDSGYRAGDLWVNTSGGESFVCVDPAVGAAVWHEIEHSASDIWDRVVTTISPVNAGDDVDLGTGNLTSNSVIVSLADFNTSYAGLMQEGRMAWDAESGTLQIGMPGGVVNLQIGQEQYLPNRPKNDEGSDIDNGQLVYISGATGSVPDVKLADAADFAAGCRTLGMATEDVTSGQRGYYTSFGVVRDVNTISYPGGTELWLDSTLGAYTDTRPTAPNCSARIGYVIRQHATEGTIFVAIDIERDLTSRDVTKDPTGFTSPEDVEVKYNGVNRTIALWETVTPINAYYQGVPYPTLEDGYTSPAHSASYGTYFLVYDGTTVQWLAPSAVKFYDLLISVVFYQAAYTFGLRECHGIQPWQSHETDHDTIGTYKKSGGTLAAYALASNTPADRRPSVSTTTIKDEDLPTVNLSLAANGPYTQFTLSSTDTINFDITGTDIVPLSTNQPYWNEFTGGAWQQTLMTNNYYSSIWLITVPCTADSNSQQYRYLWVQGQSESLTLGAQQALHPQDISLGTFNDVVPEFVFIIQVIVKYIGADWELEEVRQLDGSRFSQTSSPQGSGLQVVEHDATLTGDGTVSNPLAVVATAHSKWTESGGNLTPATTSNSILMGTGSIKVDTVTVDNNYVEASGSLELKSTSTSVLVQSAGSGNVILDPSGTGTIECNNSLVEDVKDPVGAQDAVTLFYLESHQVNGQWTRSGTDITPTNTGDNVDVGTGGLKDNDVVTAIPLGHASATTLDTTAQNLVGGINEARIVTSDSTLTGDGTSGDPLSVFQSGGGGLSVRTETGTTYTVTGTDLGTNITFTNNAGVTITFPEQSTEALIEAFHCRLANGGSGDLTIVKEGSDVLNGNTLVAPEAIAQVVKRIAGTPNTYDIYGGTSIKAFTIEDSVNISLGNGTYRIARPRFNGTIINIFTWLMTGSAVLAANSSTISGSAMTHAAMVLSSTEDSVAVTAGNVFDNGNYIDITISGSSLPSNANLLVTFECIGRL